MKKRTYYILAVVFGVILLSIVVVMLSGRKAVLYCSANSPRVSGVAEWEKTISPVQPSEELDEDFFNNFLISSDSNSLTIEYLSNVTSNNSYAFELAELIPGEPLNIGGGSLEFSAVGTAYLDANQILGDDAAYRFYDARFQRIGETRVTELGNRRIIENGRSFRYRAFPAVQFGFVSRDVEDIKFHSLKIFDASTHKLLTSGSSMRGRDGYRWFRTNIPLWHRAAVDVVIDVSYGPTKTFEFAPRSGEGFNAGSFKCRLINVFEGVDVSSQNISSTTRNNIVSHQLSNAPPDKAGLCLFSACQPQASQMPVTFKFLDKDGDILSDCGRSTSDHMHEIFLQQPREKVALIQARYRTRRQRIVIRLPYIPGLPEENNAINNLFDVHVPYIRFQDVGQVGQFLMQTLQLRYSRSTGPVPSDSINNAVFPLDFNDVTVREIAERYAQGSILRIDLENEQLTLEYPVSLLKRIELYLQKLLR